MNYMNPVVVTIKTASWENTGLHSGAVGKTLGFTLELDAWAALKSIRSPLRAHDPIMPLVDIRSAVREKLHPSAHCI